MGRAARPSKAGKRRRPGRPRRSNAGLRLQIPVRVSPEVKEALEAVADRNLRSVTAEIEARLAQSLGVGRQARIWGLMEAVGRLAEAIERRTQRRWTHNAPTARALRAGVDKVIFHFGRYGKPAEPLAAQRAKKIKEIGEAEAGKLITVIEGAVEPYPGAKPEFGPTGWGYYELRRALGSGWERNRTAWFPERKGDVS
jgi:hypothetical protein